MKTSKLFAALCGAVLLISATTAAVADIVTITPSQENSISSGFPDSSNAQGNLFSGMTVHSGALRSLMLFDIAGNVPSGATIDSVSLDLFLVKDNTGSVATFALHALNDSWGQGSSNGGTGRLDTATPGDATWNDSFFSSTPWTTPGGDFVSAASGTASIGTATFATYTFASQPGMVSDVQNWLDSPDSNIGWIMMDANEGSGVSARVFDSATSSSPPTLTVSFTPVVSTSAAWLFPTSDVWSNGANWSNGTPPNGVAYTALLNQTNTDVVAVTLDEPVTLGTLQLGSSGGDSLGYTLTGSGSNTLTLDNSGSGATIVVGNGNHVISAPVVLSDNLTVSGSGTLTFDAASSISSDGASLTMNGDGGTLILSGTSTYPGGTFVVAGTLVLASPTAIGNGTSLVVGDATSLFDSAAIAAPIAELSAAQIATVPEPTSFALVAAGAIGLLGFAWPRRTRTLRRQSVSHQSVAP